MQKLLLMMVRNCPAWSSVRQFQPHLTSVDVDLCGFWRRSAVPGACGQLEVLHETTVTESCRRTLASSWKSLQCVLLLLRLHHVILATRCEAGRVCVSQLHLLLGKLSAGPFTSSSARWSETNDGKQTCGEAWFNWDLSSYQFYSIFCQIIVDSMYISLLGKFGSNQVQLVDLLGQCLKKPSDFVLLVINSKTLILFNQTFLF